MTEVTRWKPTTGDINKIKMEVSDSGKYVKHSDYLALRQQLAEANAKVAEKVQQAFDRGLKAGNEQAQQQQMSIHEGLDKLQDAELKIADLTANLEAQEASKPVAWRLRNTAFRKPVYRYYDTRQQAEIDQADFNRSVDCGSLCELTPLFLKG